MLLPRFDLVAPGHGWAELGADWNRRDGWEFYGEAGQRFARWDLGARLWWHPEDAAVGGALVARW